MKFQKFAFLVLFSFVGSVARAEVSPDLKKAFNSMDGYRGPFGKNIIQGEGGRKITPSFPPKRLFQGAFRSNKSGRLMARDFNFYVGNQFPSNYYELMEEFVFRDKYALQAAGNDDQPDTASYKPFRPLDHEALFNNRAKAMPRAVEMARHWILEKHYTSAYPQALLTKSFQRWGVSDSGDEEIYARYFLNFYLSSMYSDLQFFPAFVLLKQSTVGDADKSGSLQTARNLVANYPNDYKDELGRIRNAIHNQLSPEVIDMIDAYVKRKGRNSTLSKVRAILVDFYSFDPQKIAKLAEKLGLKEMQDAAIHLSDDIAKERTSSLELLSELSSHAADLKNKIGDAKVIEASKKTDALLLISYATQFLNSRLTNDKNYSVDEVVSKVAAIAILNTIYSEGLLTSKNWVYFVGRVKKASSNADRAAVLSDATKIGIKTIMFSVQEALEQWKSIDPKMENFIDNAAKSSALNTASVVLLRINGKGN